MMNKVNKKSLLHSKWTKLNVINKEKHFMITTVKVDEDQNITQCIIEAVINNNEYDIVWRDLKDSDYWKIGWQ